MTINCDLCGRGTAQKALTPYWFPHTVCDRSGCREAAKDAVTAIADSRKENKQLVGEIAARHEAQFTPIGYRDDAMAEIDVVDGREWWANEIVKRVWIMTATTEPRECPLCGEECAKYPDHLPECPNA